MQKLIELGQVDNCMSLKLQEKLKQSVGLMVLKEKLIKRPLTSAVKLEDVTLKNKKRITFNPFCYSCRLEEKGVEFVERAKLEDGNTRGGKGIRRTSRTLNLENSPVLQENSYRPVPRRMFENRNEPDRKPSHKIYSRSKYYYPNHFYRTRSYPSGGG